MVRQGLIRGCDACRNSHVKCDLQQPKCSRCINRRIGCSGYRRGTDVIIKDQTIAVSNRERLRAEKRQRATAPSTALSISLLDRALQAYHVSHVSTPQKNGTVDRGYYDVVMQFWAGAAAHTAIAFAMPWLSLQMIGTRAHPMILRHKHVLLGKALKALRADLDNASAATQDHILATILVLDHGGSLDYISQPHRAPDMHLRGAVALINHRSIMSWSTITGQLFLMWMRRSAIMHAVRTKDPSIMIDNDIEDQLSKILSRDPVTALDGYAARLVRIRAKLESEHLHNFDTICEVLTLKHDLDTWRQYLPPEWSIDRVSNAPNTDFWGLRQSLFCSVHVAWFYTTCYALRIGVLALLLGQLSDYELDVHDCPSRAVLEDEACQLFDDLCIAKPYLAGHLRHPGQYSIYAHDIAFGQDMGLDRMGAWFFMQAVRIVDAVWDLNKKTCAPVLRNVLPAKQVAWLQGQMEDMEMLFSQFYGFSGR